MAIINATVLNFGKSNETDIIVQILANNTIVNSTMIGFLPNGGSTTVSLAWNPTVEGLYNVTLYVVPVPGETSVKDNVLGAYIYVGFPVKAVVLHSAGNVYSEIITNWQVLNTEWHRFGDTMVFIDYTTLNKEDITYEDIASTEADVLIISCAYDPWIGWQFTDSEIEAIKRYVYEGHGLIATASTFYYYVPNNNKLASLFGLNETTMWTATETDLLHLVNITHPLFKNVPNPLVFSDVGTALPYDGRWDQNELVDGAYLALGHYRESAIVARRGLVYISPWFEIIPAYYHHHLQLLYNAITWSRYQKPNHELIVSLETPKHLNPDESTLLNTTVSNMGLSNETNVELFLLINGTIIDSATIPELLTGSSYTLSYLWTPTIEGIYNVTAYVPPVPDEEYIRNNVASVNVRVRYVIARVAILNSWEIPPYFTGGWGNDYQTLVDALNVQGFYAQAVTNAEIISGTLSFFDVFVMVDNVPNDAAVPWVIDFWSNGGGVIAFDSSICFLCYAGILPPESAGSNGYYVYWDYGTGYQARIAAAHPITEGYEVGQIILGTSVDAEYWVDALAGSSAYPYYTMLVEDITTSNRAYVSAYEPPMAGKVVHMWDEYHWRNVDLQLMILNAMEWAAAPKYEHDLAVTLDATRFLEWDKSILLNATVTNCGLNNETSIELQLLINGTIVDYVLIPELWVGASYTLSYYWAPTTGGVSYNVTAYALPVPGENFTLNNRVTRMVYVSFYAREYLPPEWGGGGVPMGWHADDNCWQYTLPFDFPFYGIYHRTIYISSNGLITFTSPDASWSNSIYALAGKLAIAPAWDDWVTYEPYDIFIWENSTHVSVRWYVRAYGSSTIASFEAILCVNGIIQFNYAYNDGPISATIGISNGAGDILAEDVITLNYINTIVFTPAFTPAPPIQLTATVEFHQQTLNLNSCGKWITAHIELPEGYSVADIDVATIMLNGIISAELEPAIIGDYDGDGIPDLSVYFNRTQLIKYIFFKGIGYGNVTLTISGMLYDGMPFKGSAAINVSNLVGDVNCNGKVDIYDIIIAATSYGSKEGEPNWNSNANYAPPWNKIDILDIVTIIYHYGKTYP